VEIAINHKSNQNSLPLGEEIAIVKDITKRIKIEEHKEDTIITLGTMMEDQEEDIMVVTKMVITTEIMKDIEGTQEVEGDIEADFKGENAMGARVNMKRTKDISLDSKI
jgi:cold shock CspA family protein